MKYVISLLGAVGLGVLVGAAGLALGVPDDARALVGMAVGAGWGFWALRP